MKAGVDGTERQNRGRARKGNRLPDVRSTDLGKVNYFHTFNQGNNQYLTRIEGTNEESKP